MAVLSIFLIPSAASAATYYVDATLGNNSNNGTSTSTPWQTLAKVSGTTFSPGDSILFKRGETFAGTLVVGQSGTNGNPITYSTYGTGDRPLINAAGINYGVDIRTNKSYITVAGLTVQSATLSQFVMSSNVSHIQITDCVVSGGNSGYYIFSTGTYSDIVISDSTATGYSGAGSAGVKLGSGTYTDITVDNVTASSTTGINGFSLGTGLYSNITILDSSFTNHTSAGINFGAGATTNTTIANTTSTNNVGHGVSFVGQKSGIMLDEVTATNNGGRGISIVPSAGMSISGLTIDNSDFSNNGSEGFYILPSTTSSSASQIIVRSTTASNNESTGFFIYGSTSDFLGSGVTGNNNGGSGIEFQVNAGGTIASTTIINSTFNENAVNGISYTGLGNGTGTNSTVLGSTAQENENDGFNIHDRWTNVVFDGSIAISNGVDGVGADGDGFSYHDATTGIIRNSIARNNLKSAVTNINMASTTIYNNLFSHDTTGTNALVELTDGSSDSIYNNVFYNPSQQGVALSAAATTSVTVYNNVISGFDTGIQRQGSATLMEDYNIVYNTASSAWSGLTPGPHSLISDPRFTDATSLDFTLQQSSPAINAGTTTPYATDRIGNPRVGMPDIGAYEYQGTLDTTAPTVSITSPSTGATVEGEVTITATASDQGGVAGVQFILDGAPLGSEDTVSAYEITWNTTLVSDGSHTIQAIARDISGNYATSSQVTVTVSNTEEDDDDDDDGGSSRSSRSSRRSPSQDVNPLPDTTSIATSTQSSATSTLPFANFTLGSTGEAVRALQIWLIARGYAIPAGATAYFGPQTQAALARYWAASSSVGVPITNVKFYRPLFLGSTGPDVISLQQILKAKGFYLYPEITGYYGQITLQAVADYQRSINLDHLGYVGPATRAALNAL